MSYFCDENEPFNGKRLPIRPIAKRPPSHPIDFFDRLEQEDHAWQAHTSYIRPLKRIRRAMPSEPSTQKTEVSTQKMSLKEFNEQYLTRYLTEMQKYNDSMRNFN